MHQLWAPWRMTYIANADEAPACIFCTKPQSSPEQDREQLILHRGKLSFVMMNLYPYNSGHLLIAPYAHLSSLALLPVDVTAEMMLLAQRCETAIRAALNPDGFNLGINEGKVAGAGFADHVHLHIVPRWNGDTNFMPVIGAVKVMPEFLEQTYDKIKAHLDPILQHDHPVA